MSTHILHCSMKDCVASIQVCLPMTMSKEIQLRRALSKADWHYVAACNEHYLICPKCNKELQDKLNNVVGISYSVRTR